MKYFIVLILASLVISCNEAKNRAEGKTKTNVTSFSQKLEVPGRRKVTLLPEAREVASQWLAYVTAQNEINSLKRSTGHEIIQSANSIRQIMESLKSTIPDTLQHKAVKARANVLLTKGALLYQLSHKKEKDPSEIFEVAGELVVEFDNLKLQLNEMFLKTPADFEELLDAQFEKNARNSVDTLE